MLREPRNLLVPFTRDLKSDFASGEGETLLASKVRQVLATEAQTARSSGELPWRAAFGSALHLLRHRPNDDVLTELARVYVRDAFARWLPDAVLISVAANADGEQLMLRVRFRSAAGASTEVSVDVTS